MSTAGQSAQSVQQHLVDDSLRLIREYRQGLQKGECEKAAFALGKALHYLQDSYAGGHTRRVNGAIDMFQNYNLQSAHLHALDDSPKLNSDVLANAAGATSSFICMANNRQLSDQVLRNRLQSQFYLLAPGAEAGGTLDKYRPQKTRIPDFFQMFQK